MRGLGGQQGKHHVYVMAHGRMLKLATGVSSRCVSQDVLGENRHGPAARSGLAL